MGGVGFPLRAYGNGVSSSKDVLLEALATSPRSQVVTWRKPTALSIRNAALLEGLQSHRIFLFHWQTNCAWSSESAMNYRDRDNAPDIGYN